MSAQYARGAETAASTKCSDEVYATKGEEKDYGEANLPFMNAVLILHQHLSLRMSPVPVHSSKFLPGWPCASSLRSGDTSPGGLFVSNLFPKEQSLAYLHEAVSRVVPGLYE